MRTTPSRFWPAATSTLAKPCARTQSCCTTEPSGNCSRGGCGVARRSAARMKPLQSTLVKPPLPGGWVSTGTILAPSP